MILETIYRSYSEPHRHYHNLNHIIRMFNIANENNIKLTNSQVIAIWLHDVIYDIPAKGFSNEERSARLCETMYRDKIAPQIIRDTQHHIPTIKESSVVIDLDLWDLSISHRYESNNKLIRQEFSHLSDVEWEEGRIKWLKYMLDKDRIFHSEYATIEMEEYARSNLAAELRCLT